MRTRHVTLLVVSALLCSTTSGTAKGVKLKLIHCDVQINNDAVEAGFAANVCTALATSLDAKPADNTDFSAAKDNANASDQLFRILAKIPDQHTINYVFEHGDASAWKAGNQQRHENLTISITDASLNQTAIDMLSSTVQSLAR